MGNGGPGVPARPALELWVLGLHMATEVALGSPRLVPIVVFTGLGAMRGNGILGSRGEILHASSRGWHEPPWLLDTLGAHTQYTKLHGRTPGTGPAKQNHVSMASPGHADRPSSLGGRPQREVCELHGRLWSSWPLREAQAVTCHSAPPTVDNWQNKQGAASHMCPVSPPPVEVWPTAPLTPTTEGHQGTMASWGWYREREPWRASPHAQPLPCPCPPWLHSGGRGHVATASRQLCSLRTVLSSKEKRSKSKVVLVTLKWPVSSIRLTICCSTLRSRRAISLLCSSTSSSV